MTAHAETERKPMWLRVWETVHGPVAVTTPDEWAAADQKLAQLEEALARVDAELAAVQPPEADDGSAD